jgi:hypothetical protein
MKAFLRVVLPVLAVILVYQAGVAQAMTYMSASDEGTATVSDQKATTVAQPPAVENAICPENCRDSGCCSCCNCRWLYIDVEAQQMIGYTSYEFGSGPLALEPGLTTPYAPESKLDYSLNSVWTGVRLGVANCNYDVHFEWLTPMVQHIDGGIYDYDWNCATGLPRNNPTRLDSLSHSATRWNDGQQINIEGAYKYSDCLLNMPIQVWPLAGFRWQRFDMTAYGMNQIANSPNGWPGPLGPYAANQGDILTFDQQYYTGYLGFQLRRCIERECRQPINLMFQFDWGATGGYNVDRHLDYYVQSGGAIDRYTMDSTRGDTIHLALSADIPLNCRWNLGLRADYMRIRTTGTHRMLVLDGGGAPLLDVDWTNGVLVKSEQTDFTAYLQYTF